MCILCMQNVKQIFPDLWLKNEVGDVPRTTFKIDLRKRAFKHKFFKEMAACVLVDIWSRKPSDFTNLHSKILYLFPYFRTKGPALFVIYCDKNISAERRFNELSIDVSFLIFGKKIKILRSDETNHRVRARGRSERSTLSTAREFASFGFHVRN